MRPIPLIDLAAQQALIRPRLDAAIARVLDHGQYIMGPEVAELERQLAAFAGARHCVSCASGTDALLIALMAMGVRAGDVVLCPAFTYTATPESIGLLGATPLFVDVDPDTFNVGVEHLAAGLATARRLGLRTVGIIAVDLFGQTPDYAALEAFAAEHGLWVLADAAQSFGASRGGRKVGTFGTITATSFFPSKPLGCYGDGGALFSQDDRLAEIATSIRLHGRATGGDKYDIERIGINGRLDTLQAAILIEKLRIFPDELERRQAVAAAYGEGLGGEIAKPAVMAGNVSAWAQYTVRAGQGGRDRLAAALASQGIASAVYYPRPVHRQGAYAGYPTVDGGLPVAEHLSSQVLSLPMHPYLDASSQQRVIDAVNGALT